MPFTLFTGLLTLAPAVAALAILGLGLARRAHAPFVLGLAVLGALVPAICLLVVAPVLASGDPVQVVLFGGVSGPEAWFSPAYRFDAFGLYAALGLTFLIVPLLLWMAWRGGSAISEAQDDADEARDIQDEVGETDEASEADDAPDGEAQEIARRPALVDMRLASMQAWSGVALALGLEAVALTAIFADNLLWLALAWIILTALAWGLGEVGTALDALDRLGLAVMLAGPVLWAAAMLLPAVPAKASRLIDLMGRGVMSPPQIIFLALTLALAGGAYPFTVWMRRRAALTTPAGLGALVLVQAPLVLLIGARTFSAAQTLSSAWPQIGQTKPPLTAGVAFAILGALTVAISGILALGRRDGRALIAFFAVAQVGWGLVALGVGAPISIAGLVLLLATAVLGLGAMLAALFAGGAISNGDDPDSAGPHVFGAPPRPVNLAVWLVGAGTLIGVPLLAGFVPRQLTSAAALQAGGLTIPLAGVAWAGDALLALALLRATAPAFAGVTGAPASLGEDTENADDESDDADEGDEDALPTTSADTPSLQELPGVLLAVLAVIVGIAPELLLSLGGKLAAGALVQAGAIDSAVSTSLMGYAAGVGQWLPGIAWLAGLVLVLLVIFLRPAGAREARPVYLAGQTPVEAEGPVELAGLPEPSSAWQDLDAAFRSAWTLPAAERLLADADATEEGDMTQPDDFDEADADATDETETEEIEAGAPVGDRAVGGPGTPGGDA